MKWDRGQTQPASSTKLNAADSMIYYSNAYHAYASFVYPFSPASLAAPPASSSSSAEADFFSWINWKGDCQHAEQS